MATPKPPPRPTPDETYAPLVAQSGLGLFPLVGGVLQPWAQHALERGQRALVQQFLEEVAATLERHEQRVGHLEWRGFMASRDAAAALNTALGLAAKTSSREKHRILAQALLNGASTPSDGAELLPLFWSFLERYSPLDVRILHYLSDPVNLAIRAGYQFDSQAIQGECLFWALPELRYGALVERDDYIQWVDEEGEEEDEEDDEEDDEGYLGPEHDPTVPPDRHFLFWQSMRRLHDDGLLDTGELSFKEYQRDYEVMGLMLGDDPRGEDGLIPGRPFESLTELGARFLDFVSEAPPPDQEWATRVSGGGK